MRINYLTYYRLAADQFRVAGAKICVWVMVWMGLSIFSPFLTLNYGYHEYLKIMLGVSESLATPVIGNGISTILGLILISITIYSMMGVVHQTGDDPDAGWLSCGIQGILHPLRAIRVSAVIIILSIIFYVLIALIALGMAFIIPFVGAYIAILFILVMHVVYLYCATGIGYSWFIMMDDDMTGGVTAIRASIEECRGRRMPILGLLLPVLILAALVGVGMGAAYYKYLSPRLIEGELAVQTYQEVVSQEQSLAYIQDPNKFMLTESEKASYKRAVAQQLYTRPMPKYEDFITFSGYLSALAQYGVDREQFLAVRENRAVNELVQSYIDHPASSKRWGFLAFLCALVECFLVALGLVLLYKIYRERLPIIELEADPETQKHPELVLHNSPSKPEVKALAHDAPAAKEPMIQPVLKHKSSAPVMQTTLDPGFELLVGEKQPVADAPKAELVSDDSTSNADSADALAFGNVPEVEENQADVPTSEPEVADSAPDTQSKGDEIDPGFELKF